MPMLMDACRAHGIGRYHQVSTDEVYGDLPLDRPDLFFISYDNLLRVDFSRVEINVIFPPIFLAFIAIEISVLVSPEPEPMISKSFSQ